MSRRTGRCWSSHGCSSRSSGCLSGRSQVEGVAGATRRAVWFLAGVDAALLFTALAWWAHG